LTAIKAQVAENRKIVIQVKLSSFSSTGAKRRVHFLVGVNRIMMQLDVCFSSVNENIFLF